MLVSPVVTRAATSVYIRNGKQTVNLYLVGKPVGDKIVIHERSRGYRQTLIGVFNKVAARTIFEKYAKGEVPESAELTISSIVGGDVVTTRPNSTLWLWLRNAEQVPAP